MKARYITEVGTRAHLRVYWSDTECVAPYSYHDARVFLGTTPELHASVWGSPDAYPAAQYPGWCDGCKAPAPSTAGTVSCSTVNSRKRCRKYLLENIISIHSTFRYARLGFVTVRRLCLTGKGAGTWKP